MISSLPGTSTADRWGRLVGIRAFVRLAFAAVSLVAVAGCASQKVRYSSSSGRYYDPKLGVSASPRLVADGEPVPRGGGGYLTGRPYVIGGRTYYPSDRPDGYTAVGTASWYGDAFHGRRTANGEIFDKDSITAAHPTLPLPSYVRVTNTVNGRSMIVRVNDRGPYHGGRVMDVSQRVAEALAFKNAGMARIRIDYIGRASLSGSDDEKLLATLRVDGGVAQLDGASPTPSLTADADPSQPSPPPDPGPLSPVQGTALVAEQDRDFAAADAPRWTRRRSAAPVPPARPYDTAPAADMPVPPLGATLEQARPLPGPPLADARPARPPQQIALVPRPIGPALDDGTNIPGQQ